jgi:hypothetical protein
MKEEIDWKFELLSSGHFNQKEEKLLREGAKSHVHSIWLHTLYVRWQKIKGYYQPPVKAEQSSFKEWNKRVEENK